MHLQVIIFQAELLGFRFTQRESCSLFFEFVMNIAHVFSFKLAHEELNFERVIPS
jgi:hypothetical protein